MCCLEKNFGQCQHLDRGVGREGGAGQGQGQWSPPVCVWERYGITSQATIAGFGVLFLQSFFGVVVCIINYRLPVAEESCECGPARNCKVI